MEIFIPGMGNLKPETVVFDYNGTIAQDGELLPGVSERIEQLAKDAQVVILTADTHGDCIRKMSDLPVLVEVVSPAEGVGEDEAKLAYVESIGDFSCVAIGNGRNDGPMLKAAALGIAVIQREGASVRALMSADVVVNDVLDAFDLLLQPDRLRATMRR